MHHPSAIKSCLRPYFNRTFCEDFRFSGKRGLVLPSPEKIASLTVEQLRQLQFSGRKSEYVIGIAKEAAEGRLRFDELDMKSDEEIMEELIRLRGVGPWTVQNFLIFGLGRPNQFPTADIGIQNALKKLYNLERKPTIEEINEYKKAGLLI